MDNNQLINSAEITKDGVYVVESRETPSGYTQRVKAGRLKLRGEKQAREINYADYAKIKAVYNAQAKLGGEGRGVLVSLSNGQMVNTADITSLDLIDGERFIKKTYTASESEIRNLPTAWIKFDMDGTVLEEQADRHIIYPGGERYWYIAKCHYRIGADGKTREYITTPMTLVPEALRVREDPKQPGVECLSQRIVYGVHIPLSNTH